MKNIYTKPINSEMQIELQEIAFKNGYKWKSEWSKTMEIICIRVPMLGFDVKNKLIFWPTQEEILDLEYRSNHQIIEILNGKTLRCEFNFKKYKKARKEFYAEGEKINKRIDEVVRIICDEFQTNLDAWYFWDAPEGEHGFISEDVLEKESFIDIRIETDKRMNTKQICYSDGFPLEYLFLEEKLIREDVQKKMKE